MSDSYQRSFTLPSRRHLIAVMLAVAVAAGIGANVRPAYAAEAPVDLGSAGNFGVLGGQEVTNTGATVISGDVGVSPGTSVTGFPPGVYDGELHSADAVALEAQSDLTIAYDDAAGRSAIMSGLTELGGQNFTSGVYSGGALTLTGNLTLTGDAKSVWVFQASSSLITDSGSRVLLSGPVNPCNVFWQIGSTATLGSGSAMVGTIMALTSINAKTGASVAGRLLVRNAAVTLENNAISGPLSCATAPPIPPAPPAPPAIPVPGEVSYTG